MKFRFLLYLLILSNIGIAQSKLSQEQAVIKTIQTLFDGMRAGDSTALRSVLHPAAHLQSAFTNKEGISVLTWCY